MSYIGQQPSIEAFGSINLVTQETPTGTIDGVNDDFTLANTPELETEQVYLDNIRLQRTEDYTIAGTALTMIQIPLTDEILEVDYYTGATLLNDVNLASPPAIGETTPNSIKTTTLEATNSFKAANYSGRNKIINGDFTISQRGTAFDSTTFFLNSDDTYLIDRWLLLSDGNDIVDVSQGIDGSVGGFSYLRADVETVSKKFGFLQIIEQKNLRDLLDGNGNVSLGFNAKVSDAAKLSRIKAAIISWDSTADTVTSDIISAWGAEGTNPTLVANWTYENTPADLGVTATDTRFTIENIDIDTASMANVGVFIWSDDVATNDTLGITLDITNVQLESGIVATEFENRSVGQELMLCQRYYEHIQDEQSPIASGYAALTTRADAIWQFNVQKRVKPTGIQSSDGFVTIVHEALGTDTNQAVTFNPVQKNAASIQFKVASGLIIGNAGNAWLINSADEFIAMDAEL